MPYLDHLQAKIVSIDHLSMMVSRWDYKGETVVFTNGVYDLLHRGHITLLSQAADLGTKLIVGINSDSSVKTLGKGPNRPINHENDRALVLASLALVSAVVIFGAPTPYELIKIIKPQILVKGGDYNEEQKDSSKSDYIVGSDLQMKRNAQTVSIPLVKGFSTTALANKILDAKG